MTIIDYLLLGGSTAAGLYILYRLFLGWRRSGADERQNDEPQGGSATNATARHARRRTAAPWQTRGSVLAEEGER